MSDNTKNNGKLSVDATDGDVAIGIGGGMTIDSSGNLGIQVAPGLSIGL